jgi:hypothetical protein
MSVISRFGDPLSAIHQYAAMAKGGKQYVTLQTPISRKFTSELFVTRPFTLFKAKRGKKVRKILSCNERHYLLQKVTENLLL